MAKLPPNIVEFNQIAGLIFAQLYKSFPCGEDIDRRGIAAAMGVPTNGGSLDIHILPSGRDFNQMLGHTIRWLNEEGYIRALGSHPAERVMLTAQGLKAMNAAPSAPGQTLGSALQNEADKGETRDLSKIGELVGGFFGGFVKSVGNG